MYFRIKPNRDEAIDSWNMDLEAIDLIEAQKMVANEKLVGYLLPEDLVNGFIEVAIKDVRGSEKSFLEMGGDKEFVDRTIAVLDGHLKEVKDIYFKNSGMSDVATAKYQAKAFGVLASVMEEVAKFETELLEKFYHQKWLDANYKI